MDQAGKNKLHTFTGWLRHEVQAARYSLLALYEQEERLKYIEGPRLERAYMEAIGEYEESVVREEMECELLTTKQRLVQAAINRREEINEEEIDAKVDALRKDMMAEAKGEEPRDYAELSSEQESELQRIYGMIVKDYHPQMHPELSQAHRDLYDKAQAAYRRKDLQALELIWEMLRANDSAAMELEMTIKPGEESAGLDERDYSTDFSLTAQLYECFVPTQEEAPISEEWKRYRAETEQKMTKIEALQKEFPYNARAVLEDPTQIDAYRKELEQRMAAAKTQRRQLSQTIERLVGGAKRGDMR